MLFHWFNVNVDAVNAVAYHPSHPVLASVSGERFLDDSFLDDMVESDSGEEDASWPEKSHVKDPDNQKDTERNSLLLWSLDYRLEEIPA